MKVWMKVTKDKYRLPEVIALSAAELAKKCGVSQSTIMSSASKVRHNPEKGNSYISVEISEEDDDDLC